MGKDTSIPWETIWRAEIGEASEWNGEVLEPVIRNVKDRPPDWLHYQLQNSIGDFALDESAEGKVLRWKSVAGPPGAKLSSLITDLILDEEDQKLRFPKQPTEKEIKGRRSTAAADYQVRQSETIRPSDWALVNPSVPVDDDLSIPEFLRRAA